MEEIPERFNYGEWDEAGFEIPKEYISDGVLHDNPLDSEKRKSLKEQGVPDVFIGDTI